MKSTLFIFLGLVSIFLMGCKSKQNLPTPVQRNQAKFDFTPPTQSAIGSANMSIVLIKPIFISEAAEYLASPFPEMATNMGNDFQELLAAKGFTMRGPFKSKDEMVYNDKVNSSFILEIQIDLDPIYNIDLTDHKSTNVAAAILGYGGSSVYYTMNGSITFGGNLVLTASSPQYGEKIWKKSIVLEKSTFPIKGSEILFSRPTMAYLLGSDNLVYNTVTAELEKFYNTSLNLVWKQIDPEEMKIVTEQAKKADKKGN